MRTGGGEEEGGDGEWEWEWDLVCEVCSRGEGAGEGYGLYSTRVVELDEEEVVDDVRASGGVEPESWESGAEVEFP